MTQVDLQRGDYFLDCGVGLDEGYLLRAIFGAWITICVAIVAISLRSVYGSIIKRRLIKHQAGGELVSLWSISPPSSPSEVLEIWRMLAQSLRRGQFFYVAISLVCVLAAVTSTLSTTIADHTIVSNTRIRPANVPGFRAEVGTGSLNPISTITWTIPRIAALNQANAPLDQLFDFAPHDTSGWVYVAQEWNNSWQGNCNFSLHAAVDLVLYPTRTDKFQDEVPLLGSWLPTWTTLDPQIQGNEYSWFSSPTPSDAFQYRNLFITYAFCTADSNATFFNVSFANIALNNVSPNATSTSPDDEIFAQTAFKSDVHVADCTFANRDPGNRYQAYPTALEPYNLALNVASIFKQGVLEAGMNNHPFMQPTGQTMFRAAQAHMTVKDTITNVTATHTLTVSRPVLQIRLSVVAATTSAFILAAVPALILRYTEPRDRHGQRLILPSSQFSWTVQAAREHYRGRGIQTGTRFPVIFAMQHPGLAFSPALTDDGYLVTYVESSLEKGIDPSLSPERGSTVSS